MLLPKGYSERDIIDVVDRTVQLLAPRFCFSHFTEEDAAQECWVYTLQLLESGRFDPERGSLAGFVFRHCRNRLANYLRDHSTRKDAPCLQCYGGNYCGADGQPCKAFRAWKAIQKRKRHVRFPSNISSINDRDEPRTRSESQVEDTAEENELLRLIDERLPVDLRTDYLRMRDGCSLPTYNREKVEAAVKEILSGVGVELPLGENDGE